MEELKTKIFTEEAVNTSLEEKEKEKEYNPHKEK